ncbi:hypothetical protein IFM46972_04405 [Aspergillus udagawae]|uniref:Uncharacterized protein n=1 Tax=Aspergillus udagawae TaxID=91492 RepID=A0A8H3NJI8_9EURO|nr:hypothetical protein IFM46972_04405 [Aspergillus udagawae]
MQFSSIATVAIAALLTAPSLACKCYVNGNRDDGRTHSCCDRFRGVFWYGNDCKAGSISEHLSDFRNCCGGSSDCDYPGLALEETEVDYVKTIVAFPTAGASN